MASAMRMAPAARPTFVRAPVLRAPAPACPARVCAGRELEGKVVSDKMDKTATVLVQRYQIIDSRYGKRVQRTKKFLVHDENNECEEGDYVAIRGGKKRSKGKAYELANIIRKVIKL